MEPNVKIEMLEMSARVDQTHGEIAGELPEVPQSILAYGKKGKDLNSFYVYAYLREDKTPYYIGKGRGRRAFRPHSGRQAPSRDRIEFIAKDLTELEAFALEASEIKRLGRKNIGTGILRNLTDGGEGNSGRVVSAEARAKMSAAAAGKPKSASHCASISKGKKGEPKSPETRAKMYAAKKGKVLSAEHRESIRVAQVGKIISAETKMKMSAAKKGKALSAEHRARIGAATASAETMAKRLATLALKRAIKNEKT